MKTPTPSTPEDLRVHLDEAAASVANAKRALFPESLASLPDLNALRRHLYEARRSIQFAEMMAKELAAS